MRAVPTRRVPIFAVVAAAVVLAIYAASAGGAAGAAGCPSFASQADAQARFFLLGGTPARNAGGLDEDGDGVACEGLPAPYEGFATVGYNRAKGFLFGTASMPATESGHACLLGNRNYPEAPRRLRVYRVVPGADRPVSHAVGAEAQPESGLLLWKLELARALVPGRYYAAFEERQREGPFRPAECPAFRSRETFLPRSAAP